MIDTTVRIDRRRLLAACWLAVATLAVAVGVSALGGTLWIVRPVAAAVVVGLVPGTVALLIGDVEPPSVTAALLYVVGWSFVIAMVVGGLMSLFGPLVGLARPIEPLPLVGAAVVLLAAGTRSALRGPPLTRTIDLAPIWQPLPLALALVPFASVFGSYVLVQSDSNLPLLWLIVGVGLLPAVVAATDRGRRWYPLAVWSVATALVYHAGIWPQTGGHKASVMTMEQGVWRPNAVEGVGSLLPNTVLFPVSAQLGGLSVEAQWTLLNPLFVALLPVALYVVFRRIGDADRAVIGASLFAFAYPFYTLYPGGGRVATPVFFLALVGVAATDDSITPTARAVSSLSFGAGVAVSHYGTAYVVMFALWAGAVLFVGLSYVDTLRARVADRVPFVTDRVDESPRMPGVRRLFWPPYLLFYTIFALSWYLHTAKGVKYQQLPLKVVDAVEGVLYTQVTGSAANVVSKEYGSQIVATTRLVYMLLGALMALGIAYAVFRRVTDGERIVPDAYLALAGGFFAIFVGSASPAGTGFAVARVMMIIFTFAAPFVAYGLDGVLDGVTEVADRVDASVPARPAFVALGLLLAVFLYMNAGVVAEAVGQDYAPSTKLSHERLVNSENPYERARATQCRACDIRAHVWLYSNVNRSLPVYGDEFVESQTDFYSAEIQAGAPFKPEPSFYGSLWSVRNGTNQSAYLMVLPKNEDTQGVYRTKYNWGPYGGLRDVFDRSNVLYRSNQTAIYLSQSNASAP